MLGSDSTGRRPLDLEALETAVRARALEVAGSVLERALNADPQEKDAVCPSCKGPARYAGKPSKTFLSLLGNLTLIRSYFLCPACGEGFFPKDRRLGVAETGVAFLCRVGTTHHCAIPPSEPGVRVSPYRARAVTKPWIPPKPAAFHERSVFRVFRRSEYRAPSGSLQPFFVLQSSGPTRGEMGWPVP